jgi:hypothetical protein
MAEEQKQPQKRADKNDKKESPGNFTEQPLSEEDRLMELRQTAEAAAQLAEDESAFINTVEAFRAKDAERFQAELSKKGLLNKCRYICRFLCTKHCLFICSKLCRKPQVRDEQLPISEIREFARVVARIAKDEALLRQFADAVEKEDIEAFDALITKLKLEAFCHQLCHWLCSVRCRLVCRKMCPPSPIITEISFIPTSHITISGAGTGLGTGPSFPPGPTPPDNKIPPTGGTGDHPFGGLSHIDGALSIAAPFQYKVEYSTAPAGPLWTPILEPIDDFKLGGSPFIYYTRVPDAQGWYDVSLMGLLGQQYLTDWNTPADRNKIYYLKLTVRTAALVEFESLVIPVRVDNGQPSQPIIDLQLQMPDGTRQQLGCCEKIERGKGNLLVITLTATDENFGSIGVSLQGGCGVTYPIVDTSGTNLTKYYNGNIADIGYPVPATFLWDPWAAGVSPCCYLIYVTINDRVINYNSGYSVHSNSNFHSITIA